MKDVKHASNKQIPKMISNAHYVILLKDFILIKEILKYGMEEITNIYHFYIM